MAEDRGQLLVVHICWTDRGTPRQETYGPWPAADDLSHMEQISAFLKDWHSITGRTADSATLALVMDPAASLRDPEVPDGRG